VTVIVLASAKGSPGVTTSALAMAAVWPRRVLLADCDLAGGDLAAGLLRATAPANGGLLELALAARRGLSAQDVLARCLRLSATDDTVLLLPGLTDPRHAVALASSWPQIVAALQTMDTTEPARDVLIDAGRLPCPPELVTAADRVLLVARPSLLSVHHARHQLSAVHRHRSHGASDAADRQLEPAGADGIGILLVGDRPYSPSEVRSALPVPVMAVLAHDPRAATALGEGTASGRWFDRSPLMRTARRAAAALGDGPAAPQHAAELPTTTPDTTEARGQHIGQRAGQLFGHTPEPVTPSPDRGVSP
jgi:MinD-like ATPase involved in chromosome partitioning or flagellar assembly